MQIKGTVTYVEVEGGFWGIQGDDGVPYHPIKGLPKDFQKEGSRVSARTKPYDGMTIAMWGRPVILLSIEPLSTNPN